MTDHQDEWGQQQGQQQQPYGQERSSPYGQQPGGPGAVTGPDGRPPKWAPWYGISFPGAVARFFQKYARFDGRASRSEFWWWSLANAIVSTVLSAVYVTVNITTSYTQYGSYGTSSRQVSPVSFVFLALVLLWWLATLVPGLALGWRRLHDAGLSGALWLIAVFIGIVGLVFGLLPSNPDGARYDRPSRN